MYLRKKGISVKRKIIVGNSARKNLNETAEALKLMEPVINDFKKKANAL